MADQVTTYWWGVEACLDEESTLTLLNALDVGATGASVVGVFASDPESKAAITLAGAAVKLGSTAIKAVDHDGGGNGVCLYQFWVGPPCWAKPRAR